MSEEALTAATTRIERALDRIERAAAARETARSGIAQAYTLLEERHATLRARVQDTVERLDGLIADETGR